MSVTGHTSRSGHSLCIELYCHMQQYCSLVTLYLLRLKVTTHGAANWSGLIDVSLQVRCDNAYLRLQCLRAVSHTTWPPTPEGRDVWPFTDQLVSDIWRRPFFHWSYQWRGWLF